MLGLSFPSTYREYLFAAYALVIAVLCIYAFWLHYRDRRYR